MYSLLSDRGTNVISRDVNGKPIYAISGGCGYVIVGGVRQEYHDHSVGGGVGTSWVRETYDYGKHGPIEGFVSEGNPLPYMPKGLDETRAIHRHPSISMRVLSSQGSQEYRWEK